MDIPTQKQRYEKRGYPQSTMHHLGDSDQQRCGGGCPLVCVAGFRLHSGHTARWRGGESLACGLW